MSDVYLSISRNKREIKWVKISQIFKANKMPVGVLVWNIVYPFICIFTNTAERALLCTQALAMNKMKIIVMLIQVFPEEEIKRSPFGSTSIYDVPT